MLLLAAAILSALSPQDPDPEKEKKVKLWDGIPRVPADPSSSPMDFQSSKDPSTGEFFVAPIPVYNPTVGTGLTLGVGYIFPTGPKGTPPSLVGGGVFYSDSGSWFAGAGAQLHLDEDRWRLTFGGGAGELNLEFTGIGTTSGDEGNDIPISIEAGGLQVEALRRIAPSLFGGVRVRAARIRTHLRSTDELGSIGTQLSEEELDSDSASVSLKLEWDSRDATFYPTAGSLGELRIDFHPEEIGDFEYQVYDASINHYASLGGDHLLALRARLRLARGDVPYYGLSYLGAGADLRGYTVGRYQDELLVAAQAEWRWRFAERWVAAAFAGIGQVAPDIDELSGDDILPSLGAGFRFTIAPENKVSLRVDAAVGKDDYAFYIGVNEAF